VLVALPGSSSLPSGHATTAFAGAGVLAYLWRRWWPAFLVAAALVAYSRLYVGVHYPTDVLAGAAIGAAAALVGASVVRRTRLRTRISPVRRTPA
jgi:undecaprenyl-diphosphatase